MHPITLAFLDPEDEKNYENDFLAENLPYLRFVSLLAAFMYILIAATEPVWGNQNTIVFNLAVRFGIVVPMIFFTILATYWQPLSKHLPSIVLLLVMTIGLTQFLLNVKGYPDIPVQLTDGYVILIFASFTLLRFRFIHGVLIAVLMMVLILLETYLMGRAFLDRLFEYLILLTASLIGGAAGYGMEYFLRRNWVLSRIARQEKRLEIEAENLRTVQQLARTVAHEFNNPLTIIQSTYDLHIEPLIRQCRQEDLVESERTLKRIPQTIQRMSMLVQRLLNITELKEQDYVRGVRFYDLEASAPADESGADDHGSDDKEPPNESANPPEN
jgi:signal transduction histidine kinase